MSQAQSLTLEYRRPLYTEVLRPSRAMVLMACGMPVAMFVYFAVFRVIMVGSGRLTIPLAQCAFVALAWAGGLAVRYQRTVVLVDVLEVRRAFRTRRILLSSIRACEPVEWKPFFSNGRHHAKGLNVSLERGREVRIRTNRPEKLASVLLKLDGTFSEPFSSGRPPGVANSPFVSPFKETLIPKLRRRRLMIYLIWSPVCFGLLAALVGSSRRGPMGTGEWAAALIVLLLFAISPTVSWIRKVRTSVDPSGLNVSGLFITRRVAPEAIESAKLITNPAWKLWGWDADPQSQTERFAADTSMAVRVYVVGEPAMDIDSSNPTQLLAAIIALRDGQLRPQA